MNDEVDGLRATIVEWSRYRDISRQGNTPYHNDAKYAMRNQWRLILDAVSAVLAEHDRLKAENEVLRTKGPNTKEGL